MKFYDIEQAAEILEELVDRAAGGEIIGIIRGGKIVGQLVPSDPPSPAKHKLLPM